MKKLLEQRVIFVIKETGDGRMKVSLDFHPRLAKDEAEYNAWPMKKRELHNHAVLVGKSIMESFIERDKNAAPLHGMRPAVQNDAGGSAASPQFSAVVQEEKVKER